MSRSWTNARQHYYYYYREKTRQILKHYATMLLVYIEHNDSKQKWQSVYLIQAMEWNVVMYDFWRSNFIYLFLVQLECSIVVFHPSIFYRIVDFNQFNCAAIGLTIFMWNHKKCPLKALTAIGWRASLWF